MTSLKKRLEEGSSSGWSSAVPPEKCVAIGFDDPLRHLKLMMLEDSQDRDCPVVVVSGAGGCGKTTPVTKLCHDPDIKGRYGTHIFFVTVSHTYDKNVFIRNLLGEQPGISDEVAIQHWGSYLGKITCRVLLVLDDVWSDSVIKDFMYISPGYKVLVTSRMTFNQFKTYQLQPLKNQDATRLFCVLASPELSNIPDELIEKLVKCCKFHPLVLTVMGGMLKGARPTRWKLIITNYGYYFSEIQNFPEPQYLSGLTRIRLDHVSISSISTTILKLENLQKLSLIMCKLGKSFNQGISNKLTSLLEINIESCDDLTTFPAMLCNLVGLQKLNITNCHELTSLSEEFGNLSSLEVLRLASCSKLQIW
ncbi:putative P-loop containing nucleoside triphosphate hydrolase, leucine-rich repeat domain superfamily [Helianthus anomalus]